MENAKSFLAVSGQVHLESLVIQEFLQPLKHRSFIINNQNRGRQPLLNQFLFRYSLKHHMVLVLLIDLKARQRITKDDKLISHPPYCHNLSKY